MNQNPYAPPTAVVADAPAAASSPRPRQVTWAVVALWVSFVIGLPGAMHNLFTQEIPPGISRTLIVVISLVVYLLVFAFMLWWLGAVGKGRRWGRVLLVILMFFWVLACAWLFSVSNLAGMKYALESNGTNLIVFWCQFLLYVAATVLVFTPASKAWFAEQRAARLAESGS
jgi:hypothetical protein